MFADLISLAMGYAAGFGRLDCFKPSAVRIARWEERLLSNLASKPGWIKNDAVLGSGAWSESDEGSGSVSLSHVS